MVLINNYSCGLRLVQIDDLSKLSTLDIYFNCMTRKIFYRQKNDCKVNKSIILKYRKARSNIEESVNRIMLLKRVKKAISAKLEKGGEELRNHIKLYLLALAKDSLFRFEKDTRNSYSNYKDLKVIARQSLDKNTVLNNLCAKAVNVKIAKDFKLNHYDNFLHVNNEAYFPLGPLAFVNSSPRGNGTLEFKNDSITFKTLDNIKEGDELLLSDKWIDDGHPLKSKPSLKKRIRPIKIKKIFRKPTSTFLFPDCPGKTKRQNYVIRVISHTLWSRRLTMEVEFLRGGGRPCLINLDTLLQSCQNGKERTIDYLSLLFYENYLKWIEFVKLYPELRSNVLIASRSEVKPKYLLPSLNVWYTTKEVKSSSEEDELICLPVESFVKSKETINSEETLAKPKVIIKIAKMNNRNWIFRPPPQVRSFEI